MVVDLSKSTKLKNNKCKKSIYIPNTEALKKSIFLTSNTKKTFNRLR